MKKTERIKVINSQNFLEAVKFTVKLKHKIITHLCIRSIVLPLGCIMFLVLSVLLTLGFLSSLSGPYSTFISEKFSFIYNFWGRFTNLCNQITPYWYWHLLICLAVLYLIPFAFFSFFVLLVNLLTRVKPPILTGNHIEQVKQLCEYCSKIRCSNKLDWRFHALWSRITTFSFLATMIAYDVYALLTVETPPLFLIFSVPLYFLYGLFINTFILSIKFYYKDKNEDYYTLLSCRQTKFTAVIAGYIEKLCPTDEKGTLIKNYREHGNNDYVKAFISSYDKELRGRKNRGGDYNSYSDLWEKAKWLKEMGHPDAKKYEAIVCWCAYRDYRCSKLEQETAYKRFLELGVSCMIADGYCMSYYVHHEPSIHNPDPLGIRDGVHVDGSGI